MSQEKVEKTKISAQTKHIPKDAQVIVSIMKELNLHEFEPRVVNQLLDFVYRYVTCILDDAKVYANHARKKTIDLDDVRLAIEINKEKSFTAPLPRQEMAKVSELINSKPLPPVKPLSGLRLPPDRYCLLSCNYKMRTTQTAAVRKSVKGASESRPAQKSVIKTTNSGATKRQAPTSKAQVAAMPKPVIKFTTGKQTAAHDMKMETNIDEGNNVDSEAVADMTADLGMDAHVIVDRGMKREHEEDDFEIV